jgi:hypothetical protein
MSGGILVLGASVFSSSSGNSRSAIGFRCQRAVSLLEAVIAVFLLLAVLTFTLDLYSRSLGYLSKSERNGRAASFADNVLSELRNWAGDIANFQQDPWVPFVTFTDPDYPGFQANVTTKLSPAMSPCSDQERDRPSDRQVIMSTTLKVATVDISFEGEPLFKVSALLSEPQRQVALTNSVVVEPVGSPPASLPPDATQRYKAKLLDAGGEEIKDVKFAWSVQPLTGNASISEQARDGSWGDLTNVYIVPPGDRIYVGGQCQALASATYCGKRYQGRSAAIALSKP